MWIWMSVAKLKQMSKNLHQYALWILWQELCYRNLIMVIKLGTVNDMGPLVTVPSSTEQTHQSSNPHGFSIPNIVTTTTPVLAIPIWTSLINHNCHSLLLSIWTTQLAWVQVIIWSRGTGVPEVCKGEGRHLSLTLVGCSSTSTITSSIWLFVISATINHVAYSERAKLWGGKYVKC